MTASVLDDERREQRAVARLVASHARDEVDERLLCNALGIGDVWRFRWTRTVQVGGDGRIRLDVNIVDVRAVTAEQVVYIRQLIQMMLDFQRTGRPIL